MTGIVWQGNLPRDGYEIELEAMRVEGQWDFCFLCFPIGRESCVWKIGGETGSTSGLDQINNTDFMRNQSTLRMPFELRRWYRVRLRVTSRAVEGWIDQRKVFDVPRVGRRFSITTGYEPMKPLGLASWGTTSAIRNVRLRPAVGGAEGPLEGPKPGLP